MQVIGLKILKEAAQKYPLHAETLACWQAEMAFANALSLAQLQQRYKISPGLPKGEVNFELGDGQLTIETFIHTSLRTVWVQRVVINLPQTTSTARSLKK